jgi:hypothetical protein
MYTHLCTYPPMFVSTSRGEEQSQETSRTKNPPTASPVSPEAASEHDEFPHATGTSPLYEGPA